MAEVVTFEGVSVVVVVALLTEVVEFVEVSNSFKSCFSDGSATICRSGNSGNSSISGCNDTICRSGNSSFNGRSHHICKSSSSGICIPVTVVTPFVEDAVVVFVALVTAVLMAVPPFEVAIVVISTSVAAMTPFAEVTIVALMAEVITFVKVVAVVVVSQLQ